MSFKLALKVGPFEQATYSLKVRLDPEAVRNVIVLSGGILTEQHEDPQTRAIARAVATHGKRPVLGFIEHEYVTLHEAGFLMVTIGHGSQCAMYRFLSCMCREHGCELLHGDDGTFMTNELLDRLEQLANEESQ